MSLPNQLTSVRMILTPVFVSTLFLENIYFKHLSIFIFAVAAFTDWYDGHVARKFGYITKWGKFWDPLADKIFISSAFVSFIFLGYVKAWMVAVIVFRDFLITGLRFYSMLKDRPIITNNLAKWKTVSQLTAIFFILVVIDLERYFSHHGEHSALVGKIYQTELVWKLMLFVTFLTAASGVVYLIENRKHLKNLAVDFYRVFIPSDS